MPPLRTPLGLTSGNRQYGCEYSPYQRGLINGYALAGYTPTAIALGLNVPSRSIWSTIDMDHKCIEGKSLPCTGRPKSLSNAQERLLIHHLRLFPKDTYQQVKTATGLEISTTTIKKIMKRYGITNWKAKRRPFLTEKHAATRLA